MPVVRLLGPVDVVDDDGVVHTPGSPLRRTLLALLALEPGRVITADQLLDRVWDGEPPESGLRALRFHISKLRAELDVDDLIVTVGSGYRLDADTDLSLVDDRQPLGEAGGLDARLGAWRGPPLDDTSPCTTLEHARRQIDELHLTLNEQWYAGRLADGDTAIIGELTWRCLEHPLRESLWAILVEAHYRAGHQAQALRSYEELRFNLRDELGVEPCEQLQHLERQILGHDADLESSPAGRSTARAVGNLPSERTPLIGRVDLVTSVCALLHEHRLVTLTGVGGVGKTRLALAVARRRAADFADGVWLVKLAEISDDDAVASQLVTTLGIRSRAGMSTLDVLTDTLLSQQVMLVLDNCEHVVDGASGVVDRIFDGTQGVTLLATSRERLGVAGEHLVAVPPLRSGGFDSPAVELFVQRGAEVGWKPSDGDRTRIGELCRRLDGVPLAIELAAARTRSMPLTDIAARLDDRFRLLTGRRRSVARHRSLRTAVAWSYDLLDPDEQRVFDRLSVFAGPFELAAAEHVCSDDDLDAGDVDELLTALVDKSMVVADGAGYELLEMLRQFGEERLADNDDPHRVRDAHLAHYVEFASAADAGLRTPDQGAWWRRLSTSWPNIHSAFEWAMHERAIDAAMRLVTHLRWAGGEHLHEAPARWAEQLITLPDASMHPLYPGCLGAASQGAAARGELTRDLELAGLAVAAQRDRGGCHDYYPLWALATCHQIRNHTDRARDLYVSLSDSARAAGDRVFEAYFLGGAAFVLQFAGRHEESLPIARNARRIAESAGCPSVLAFAMLVEGGARRRDASDRAIGLLDRAHEIASSVDAGLQRFQSDTLRAAARVRAGDPLGTVTITRENSEVLRRRGLWGWWTAAAIPGVVALEQLGDAEVAALLYPLVSNSPFGMLPHQRQHLDEVQARLVEALGDDRYRTQSEQGARLSFADASLILEQAAKTHTARAELEAAP